MALTDETILFVLLILIVYVVLWSRSWLRRIIADVTLIVLGLASYLLITVDYPWGIFITIIAGIDLLLNITKV